MPIYTRSGDQGETSLFAGGRIRKGHPRLHAYGTVDELNSLLGLVLASGLDVELVPAIQRVQSDLFSVGADLATPLDVQAGKGNRSHVRVVPEMIARLEDEIDHWEASLPVLKSFILPGGELPGAFLHVARTVCRRAERWLALVQEDEPINLYALQYLNRLSDWLFVAARVANARAGREETPWHPPTAK
ncbi:MAG: cob(I)yrinic acid a,c-diamide adenosyltransferase [Anaerolineae bacterium]|nr:cob(I)yrinic acid a,c-diamide adenosyltransferase [Anaerolineae bacterium]